MHTESPATSRRGGGEAQAVPPLRFAFITSNSAWGGSEELWSAAAAALAKRGHRISVYKGGMPAAEPRIQALRALGCRLTDLARPRYPLLWRSRPLQDVLEVLKLALTLFFSSRPDLVIISQGGNADGWMLGALCRRMKLPYVLIVQKASDLYWPYDKRRGILRDIYSSSLWCFFVSNQNLQLTQEQLALELPHSSVVRNPFLVRSEVRRAWPEESRGLRLACVARLHTAEKGQDMVLRVLAQEKWRRRALSVTFFGMGQHRNGLEEMARYLNLASVSFAGFVRDVDAIWDDHHGLVLPSRCEGMPLAVVEAMMSGRLPIVTDVGGARELVNDGTTGFVAAAATESSLDDALERAWERRAEWRTIGTSAATSIRTLVPLDPAVAFADTLEQVARQRDDATACRFTRSGAAGHAAGGVEQPGPDRPELVRSD
jgi:glycosyltransferase involved in cell wall biosynthesis